MKDIKEYKVHTQKGILLNANEMSDNISSSVLKEIQEGILHLDLNRYPDNCCIQLREAYSRLLNVRVENVLAGNGSDQILGLLIGYFLKEGKTLLTLDPDFSMYDYYCAAYEADILKYSTKEDGSFDVENFIGFAIDNQVDMVLFSNPNNPTGFMLKNDDIRVMLKRLNTIPVVIDEAYAEFANESAVDLIDQFDNLYITRTLSKAYALAGARVGFLISNEKNIKEIHKANVPYVLNCVSQMIATIVLKHVDEFRNNIETIKKKRDEIIHSNYESIHIYKSQANFVKVKCSNLNHMYALFDQNHVVVRKYEGKDYFRLTIGNNQEYRLIKNIFDQFEKEENDHAKGSFRT